MLIDELESEILKLDPEVRAKLAAALLRSLEDLTDAENERLWVKEAERRHNELMTGAGKERPADDVLRDIRSRI